MRREKTMSAAGRKVIITMSALLMVAGASMTANAANTGLQNGTQNGTQGGKNADTEVLLGVGRENAADVSFEVPLYYTIAITKGKDGRNSQVLKPGDYSITNTTFKKDANGNEIKNDLDKELAVVSVGVRRAPYSNWDLVEAFDGSETAADRKMTVALGGLPLPSLVGKAAGEYTSADIKGYNSVFYNKDENKFHVIGDQNGDGKHEGYRAVMKLDMDVAVQPSYIPKEYTKAESSDPNYEPGSTVAQFQIIYMLSPLDENGDPIGRYNQMWVDENYFGPKKTFKSAD